MLITYVDPNSEDTFAGGSILLNWASYTNDAVRSVGLNQLTVAIPLQIRYNRT